MKTLASISICGALAALVALALIFDDVWCWAGAVLMSQGIVIWAFIGSEVNPFQRE